MAAADDPRLARALRTEAASGEAGTLWCARILAVAGLSALLSTTAGPGSIVVFGDRAVTWPQVVGTALLLVAMLATVVRRRAADRLLLQAKSQVLRAGIAAAEAASQAMVAEEVARMGSWRIHLPDRAQTWSQGVFRIFGLPVAEAPPSLEEVIAFYQPDDRARIGEQVEAALLGRHGFDFEHVITRRDGERRSLHVRGRFAEEEDGRGSLYGVVQDVTVERAAFDALGASEAKYRLVTDHATDMIATMTLDSRVRFVSPACTRILGYTPQELIGRKTLDLTHPEDAPAVVAHFGRLIAAGPQGRPDSAYEFRGRRRDGGYVWLEGRPRVEFGPTGAPVGYQDVVRDITARKAAEAAAAEARARASENEGRYRLLAENATDMISRYGLDGRIRYVSPASADVLGRAPREMVGMVMLDLVHPDDLARVRSQFAAHLAAGPGGAPLHTEHRVICKDGRVIWLEGRPRLVRDAQGRPVEFHDVMRDITARKALETELDDARLAAEAAARAKSDFLANMSHELRTPLTSIVGYTALLADGERLEPGARDYVRRVQNASRALLSTVNDILDFSKIEAGRVMIREAPADATAVCRNTVELFTQQAAAKGLRLELAVGAPPPARVLIDADRLSQLLLNLVGNAVKFTDGGGVRVGLAYGAEHLIVTVRDTGPGIPAEALGGLFKRFSQVDGSTTRTHGGTGLGLAICRGLAERMGGSVRVESMVGEGSCFTLEVPAPPAKAPAPAPVPEPRPAPAAAGLHGVRVLVVDDTQVTRELARIVLAGAGAQVWEADGGEAALALGAAQPVDVVLLDLRMPDVDGREVLRRLRATRGPNDRVPVIAYTAEAGAAASGVASPFDAEVGKPVEPARLIAAVRLALDRTASPPAAARAG